MKLFVPLTSKNERDKTICYGIKHLVKAEKSIEDKLRRQAKRDNKTYLSEMLHVDTKRLPLLKNETKQQTREHLFVGIDDFSRELYAGIYPDNSQFSSAQFLQNDVLANALIPLHVFIAIMDANIKAPASTYLLKRVINTLLIKNSSPSCPQTNGKAERVIRTLN